MLFSVITIAKNARAALAATADSVQNQTFTAYEWLIIDGASADGTVADLPAYTPLVITEQDTGIYDAMNKGLARATGDYVLFLNAGDRLAATDTLETIAAALEAQTALPDFIYGDSWEAASPTTPPLHYKRARSLGWLPYGMPTHHQAMLYRRDTIGTLRFDTSYAIAGDYDFTCRFLKQDSSGVLRLSVPLTIYALGGVSMQQASQGRWENFCIRQKLRMASWPVNIVIYAANALAWIIRRPD